MNTTLLIALGIAGLIGYAGIGRVTAHAWMKFVGKNINQDVLIISFMCWPAYLLVIGTVIVGSTITMMIREALPENLSVHEKVLGRIFVGACGVLVGLLLVFFLYGQILLVALWEGPAIVQVAYGKFPQLATHPRWWRRVKVLNWFKDGADHNAKTVCPT